MNSEILKVKRVLREAVQALYSLYASKGINPFKLPVLVIFSSFLVLYLGVYGPIKSKLIRNRNELTALEMTSRYSGVFEDYRSRISGFQRRLPPIKNKSEWLKTMLIDTSQQEDIIPESISQQTETPTGEFIVVSREVGTVTTYDRLGRWVAGIENAPYFIRVSEFNAKKEESRPGYLKVTFKVSTLFIKPGIANQ
ncbi:MAG: hypothetical protein ABIG11_10835 [bacterium]